MKLLRFIQKPTCKRCLKFLGYLIQAHSQFVEIMLMQTFRLPNIMFAKGRFGNVVSDDLFHLVACFSFLSNIISICIATKRKNIGAGLRGCTTPFFLRNHTSSLPPLLLRRGRSIIVRSTVTDYSLFTIHYSLFLMQHHVCPCLGFAPRSRGEGQSLSS